MFEVVALAMSSGSRKKIPTPARSVIPSMSAIEPLPSSTPSSPSSPVPAAWTVALRTSQRVPTNRVSYRTTARAGTAASPSAMPWKPESRRSVA